MKRLFAIFFILIFSVFIASAQESEPLPNDPNVNEDANACSEGGSMEGKCNVDFDGNGTVDDYEVTWAWECGWHMIRLDSGMISQSSLPERCQSLIELDVRCFVNSFTGIFAEMKGGPNQPANVVFYFGGCGHEAFGTLLHSSLIFANSPEEAYEICSQFGTVYFLAPLNTGGYSLPTGEIPDWVYGCDYF